MGIPPAALAFGPFSIKIYSLCLLFGILAGVFLIKKRAPLYKIEPKIIDDALPYLIAGAVVGARLYHVIDNWAYYKAHIFEIFAIWHGGIAIYGGLLGGALVLYYYSRKVKLPFLVLADVLAPGILLAQAIGRWGNYFNQEAFGPPTNLPWKIAIDPAYRPPMWQHETYFHPLFLYESLWDLTGVGILLLLSRRREMRVGSLFGSYLIWYGLGRFLVEQLRFDTATLFGLKTASLLSILGIAIGVVLILKSPNYFRK